MGMSYNNKNNIIIITVYSRAGVHRVHEALKKKSRPGRCSGPTGRGPRRI